MKICKRIVSFALALVLAAVLPVTAAADAWIPPDDQVNYAILSMIYNNGECLALNAFVSNYAEANLREFGSGTSDEAAIAGTLKHFELNPGLFPDDVSSFVGEDGKTYMKIRAEKFETRIRQLYGRNIAAKDCPGYEDGYIIVSAENYGAAIRVFAVVSYCGYLGDGCYEAEFQVFYVSGGVTDEYGISYYDILERGYTLLGTGWVHFYFGDPYQTSFRSADFQLQWFSMDAEGIPCTNANLPMAKSTSSGSDAEPTTEPATEVTTEATTEATTEPETSAPPTEESTGAAQYSPKDQESGPADASDSGTKLTVVLIVVLVILVAVLALEVILLLFKVKRK